MNCPRCKRTAEEAKVVQEKLQSGEMEYGPDACSSETCIFDFIVAAHYDAVEDELHRAFEDRMLEDWAKEQTVLAYG